MNIFLTFRKEDVITILTNIALNFKFNLNQQELN